MKISDIHEITFMMHMAVCHCYCGHCKAVGKGQLSRLEQKPAATISFAVCREIMERFRTWRDKNDYQHIRMNFGDSECSDYPEICDKIAYAREIKRRHAGLVMCNGMRIKPEAEQHRWLQDIYDAGARVICNTIYGTEQEHDRYAGRAGDFEHIVLLNNLASKVGLNRMHVVFFAKSRRPYLEEIVDKFSSLPGKVYFEFRPFYGPMHDPFIQSERVSKEEWDALPEFVRKNTQFPLKTQREWVDYFISEYDDPLRYSPQMVLDFHIGMMGADKLLQTDVEELLEENAAEYMQRWNNTVSLSELARKYGQTGIEKDLMYTFGDIESSWVKMYMDEHPEHGPIHQFGFESKHLKR
ncbi:MAG: hypothetical protein QM793_02035 [Muricomes sp.]